ncbi:MAG: sugar transferase [Opitutus sp.]
MDGRFEKVIHTLTRPTTLAPTVRLGAKGNALPWWKRSLDLVGCFLALPLLALCTLVMFVVMRRVSPGPVFYYQDRIGYMGRRFRLFKFRTMKQDADCAVHDAHCTDLIRTNAPMIKLDQRSDARLIPFAWILRAAGLDELPQIINVLRGEMSLVGPRPCTPAEFAHYRSWHRQRCDALPGLTGLWQVSGKNRTTFEEMIGLDLRYTRNVSLWQDLRIIALTPCCLLRQVRETRRARAKLAEPRTIQTACGEPGTA